MYLVAYIKLYILCVYVYVHVFVLAENEGLPLGINGEEAVFRDNVQAEYYVSVSCTYIVESWANMRTFMVQL